MGFSPAKWTLYQNWVNTVQLVIWARKTQVISCPQIVLNFCAYNFGAKHQYLWYSLRGAEEAVTWNEGSQAASLSPMGVSPPGFLFQNPSRSEDNCSQHSASLIHTYYLETGMWCLARAQSAQLSSFLCLISSLNYNLMHPVNSDPSSTRCSVFKHWGLSWSASTLSPIPRDRY